MNMNEVLARLASEASGLAVHPNDHVNMSQSSNDVIPSAIHVSAAIEIDRQLLPALRHLANTIDIRATELAHVVKTGRTHLMDALPITLGQELGAWRDQILDDITRIEEGRQRLHALPQGGTAVGTGLNAAPEFGDIVCHVLAKRTGLPFHPMKNPFVGIASQDTAVEMSGHLKTLAVSLMKISNDLRWMNSGPLAGLGEIRLPALQPGSSIMPGKVNPVIPEAVAMVCAQVFGNDATANGSRLLADRAIDGFEVDTRRLREALDRNPILVTALNRAIGYEQGAAIAKRAYAEGRPVLDVAVEMTDLSREELARLLDPIRLTEGGLPE